MILFHDRASMAHVLTLDLDPQLRRLLERRFAALVTPYGDLRDVTDWVIVQSGDSEEDLTRVLGFSPLVEPIDGIRFGEPGFEPFWDHLVDHGGWYEIAVTHGSTFANLILVQDVEGTLPELRALCRRFAA